ncbi:MAG TPA: hypothetical protein VL574_02620 [Stellaceae bacterium]|jgi:hypothetical protein|nr:hypothetical protein [Stellaceae bacterium]
MLHSLRSWVVRRRRRQTTIRYRRGLRRLNDAEAMIAAARDAFAPSEG